MSNVQIGIQIILMFFLLVTLHEWGHFYFAKRAGILVREFAIGFGPKLFSYKKGETTYTLRLLPIGGYVRMAGEDPEIVQVSAGQTIGIRLKNDRITHLYLDQLDQRSQSIQGEVEAIDLERELFVRMIVDGESVRFPVEPHAYMVARGKETQIAPWDRQFGSKTVAQRAMSIAAGPVMNFLLAFLLFLIVMVMNGMPTNVKLGKVEADSPAYTAGLKEGDIVLEVNHTAIGSDSGKLSELIQASKDQPMMWIIERNKEQMQKTLTPKQMEDKVRVGITLTYDKRSVAVGEAISGAWDQMVFVTQNILVGFKQLLFGQFKMDDLGGPVRIVEVSGQFASAGLAPMISWSALLSLYLGIFNLLPFPALDGSRLVFLAVEAVRGRPIDPNRESIVHFIGFAMLMLLMIAVTYNDILRLIQG
ncbi:RIP metalloprotease RseP [Gorillibacterium sp. sgz5001074]|uniref:RIP metalloprotease RseP n=1 Tax=Gorillibacterium sp. sgz5001074 TaxID=3446695 RepID=UPI003F681270